MKKLLVILFFYPCFSTCVAQQYIFYLHGKIIENQGPDAVDNVNGFGAYKYYDILDSLRQKKMTVFSEVRPKNTDIKEYALKIKKQIDSLLKTGADPKKITVIGASKGSVIAMYVSTYLKNKLVNYVFMAACSDDMPETTPDIHFYGNVLSIYEKSDGAGSCTRLRNKSTDVIYYKEIELNTGLRHGFLYKPLPEWLNPAKRWANNDYD